MRWPQAQKLTSNVDTQALHYCKRKQTCAPFLTSVTASNASVDGCVRCMRCCKMVPAIHPSMQIHTGMHDVNNAFLEVRTHTTTFTDNDRKKEQKRSVSLLAPPQVPRCCHSRSAHVRSNGMPNTNLGNNKKIAHRGGFTGS